jgi:hypothetical protein
MSKPIDVDKKKDETKEHLSYWVGEVLTMWEETERKQALKSSSQEAP